ncbi:MAG: choice-of-anchor J domain-containing protein [Crocinitomicaceae bacterium]|nr:choice-of-anchor J domain-containing protein [Crocinitomicaceae bacterium]
MKTFFTCRLLLLPAFFLTLCGSDAEAQSFTEGFETTNPLTDWYIRNNSDTLPSGGSAPNDWFFGETDVFTAHSGSSNSYIAANYQSSNITNGPATLSNWLFTPVRTFSNGDVISFFTRTVSSPTSFPDRLELRLSTAGGSMNVGTTSSSVGDFTMVLLTVNPNLTSSGYPGTWTQYTATISGLPSPATGRAAFRYYVTNGGPSGANSNYIGLDSYSYTSVGTPPVNNNCAGAIALTPGSECTPTDGNVNFATQSLLACGEGDANDDVWYKFTAATTSAYVTVDGSTNFDATFEVFSGDCNSPTSLECVDDSFTDETETKLINNLTIGQTYYIRVFDWYSGVPGTTGFTICVQNFVQCVLTAPVGSIPETEQCGQDINGGCFMEVPAYQTLLCGQTVAGTAWADGENIDTDWYKFSIVTPGTVTWTATAEFPFSLVLVDITDCTDPIGLAEVSSIACQNATVSFDFTTPGTYAAVILPNVLEDYPCGSNNDYYATLALPTTTPVVSAAGTTTICQGASVTLNATGNGAFQWFNGDSQVGSTSSSHPANATGSYTAKLMNDNGCLSPASNAVQVTVNSLDDATFSYSSNTLCLSGANPTPTAATPGTYSSSPGGLNFVSASTGQINLSTSTPGTYSITHITTGACPNTSAPVSVTLTNSPVATFTYTSASYCTSATNPAVQFAPEATAGTFSSTPNGLSLNSTDGTINLAASTPGSYTVTNNIAASGSCPSANATFAVTVVAQPTAVVSGGGNICNSPGETGNATVVITLTGSAPFSFTYTDGTTPVSITNHNSTTYTIEATSAGTYTVSTVSDANCSGTGSGSASVEVYNAPVVTFDAIPPFCSNSSPVTLTQGAPAGGTYSGSGVSNNSFNPANALSGTVITYTYTDNNGCTGSASSTVSFSDAPVVTLSAFEDMCLTDPVIVLSGGSPSGGTYSGTAVTGGNFTPANAGTGTHTITYTYTNNESCTASATQSLTVEVCQGISENGHIINYVTYPNPARESVYVSFETQKPAPARILLTSLEGKTVFSQFIAPTASFLQEINIAELTSGMYFIEIRTVEGSAVSKLIVE